MLKFGYFDTEISFQTEEGDVSIYDPDDDELLAVLNTGNPDITNDDAKELAYWWYSGFKSGQENGIIIGSELVRREAKKLFGIRD